MRYNLYKNMGKASGHTIARTAGFTAVELLITLFVAAIFLSAGYILYNVVVTRSSEARHQIEADSIASDYLQRYRSLVGTTCVASTPLSNSAITGSDAASLASPKVTVTISCPIPALNSISKITVKVDYKEGGTNESVQHEAYASRS